METFFLLFRSARTLTNLSTLFIFNNEEPFEDSKTEASDEQTNELSKWLMRGVTRGEQRNLRNGGTLERPTNRTITRQTAEQTETGGQTDRQADERIY